MRRLLKFLHSMAAVGMTGGLAAYMVVLHSAPEIGTVAEHAALRDSVAIVSKWLIVPSMAVVLLSGIFAMAIHFPFHNAPWVWLKLVAGILIFESTLATVDAAARKNAEAVTQAVAGEIDPAMLATAVKDYWGAWWVILALCVANIAVGVWRPWFGFKRE